MRAVCLCDVSKGQNVCHPAMANACKSVRFLKGVTGGRSRAALAMDQRNGLNDRCSIGGTTFGLGSLGGEFVASSIIPCSFCDRAQGDGYGTVNVACLLSKRKQKICHATLYQDAPPGLVETVIGRSPGSRVVILSLLPGSFLIQWCHGEYSSLTVAGTAPDLWPI